MKRFYSIVGFTLALSVAMATTAIETRAAGGTAVLGTALLVVFKSPAIANKAAEAAAKAGSNVQAVRAAVATAILTTAEEGTALWYLTAWEAFLGGPMFGWVLDATHDVAAQKNLDLVANLKEDIALGIYDSDEAITILSEIALKGDQAKIDISALSQKGLSREEMKEALMAANKISAPTAVYIAGLVGTNLN